MPKIKKNYYDIEEEEAVIEFIEATDYREKERIYRTKLVKPINKMIESIIRRYQLYPKNETFEDIHSDALSYLITKFDRFDHTTGKKSYSYFGTTVKNYLMGEMKKVNKRNSKLIDYDSVYDDIINRDDMKYDMDDKHVDLLPFIKDLSDKIKEELIRFKEETNEFKIGVSLVELLNNWEDLFGDVKGTSKFNKNLILFYLRNMTGLDTKEIRRGMKVFKTMYIIFKDDYDGE
jgi:DNA-directed RNA polymerase specialized sigma subunit